MQGKVYNNPVVRGFYPDPSLIRVGEDYYLVNSTFEYFPAIPIQHSRDLVHWETVGHAITQSDALDLSDIFDSHGIWAPDISCYNGKFYIFAPFRLNNEPENQTGRLRIQLVMTADRPEGPYSKPWVLEIDSIAPSHFVDDDGTHYVITAPGVTVTKLSSDCKEILTPPVQAWTGTNSHPEGPHILKKDGWYYAILAEGGTGYGHRVSVARAKDIYGPYETCPHNPVLMQTDPEAKIQRSGHAKLVETQNGEWWMMYLCGRLNEGKYTTLGRETALDPVTWTNDGWFIVNDGKGPSEEQTYPNLPEVRYPKRPRDDFDSDELGLDWVFVRNPKPGNWSLTERRGWLRLKGSLYDINERRAYNTLVRRETEHCYTAETRLDYTPTQNRQEAGLVCYCGIYSYMKLCKVYDDGVKLRVIQCNDGEQSSLGEWNIPQEQCDLPVQLRVEVERQERRFYYSFDGRIWTLLASRPDCRFLCGEGVSLGKHHTGTMVGIYSHNPAHTYTYADFDWFEYHAREQ